MALTTTSLGTYISVRHYPQSFISRSPCPALFFGLSKPSLPTAHIKVIVQGVDHLLCYTKPRANGSDGQLLTINGKAQSGTEFRMSRQGGAHKGGDLTGLLDTSKIQTLWLNVQHSHKVEQIKKLQLDSETPQLHPSQEVEEAVSPEHRHQHLSPTQESIHHHLHHPCSRASTSHPHCNPKSTKLTKVSCSLEHWFPTCKVHNRQPKRDTKNK